MRIGIKSCTGVGIGVGIELRPLELESESESKRYAGVGIVGGKFDAKIGRRWTLKIGGRLASKTAGTGVENQATHPSSVFIGLRHATHE